MKRACLLALVVTFVGCGTSSTPPPAAPQVATSTAADADLTKVLTDVNYQWLCAGPYRKSFKDCVEFRSKYWVDQFFEVVQTGDLLNKEEMVATQTASIPSNPPAEAGPYPDALIIKGVYGDVAMGTDHTNFKTADKSGNLPFTNNAKVLRIFVKVDGTWRPAAAGLVPIISRSGPAAPVKHSTAPRKSPDEALEKQLAQIDHDWLDSAMNKKLDYLEKLFTAQWFEILGWNPTANPDKASTIQLLGAANWKAGEGVVPDQFQLQAVYGDVVLATDRRTRTWTNAKGQMVHTPHRSVLVFVKQNGEWKSAGASLTPIMNP
jgi:ketosteroid isomerase-like protein